MGQYCLGRSFKFLTSIARVVRDISFIDMFSTFPI